MADALFLLKTAGAGLLAALAALGLNHTLLKLRLGNGATLVLLGPLGEETLKTGLSLWTGASLPGVHSVFGLVEGTWELASTPRRERAGKLGPALAAVAGHSLFGLLAFLAYARYGGAGAAWLAGFLAHLGWNQLILAWHYFFQQKT
ncbi:MAG: hypothetical protein H5T99_00165 [Moorella sp. (in: Bacteria)]|nr:hypothetical protein [Moorella sp. (in: firmicutes)]